MFWCSSWFFHFHFYRHIIEFLNTDDVPISSMDDGAVVVSEDEGIVADLSGT